MAQVQDAALARSFLDQFSATITRYTDDHNTADSIFRNIAFSYSGLQRLGVTDTELEEMPAEFQQGMASRAGLIGDVRGNHPDHWPMAERNWPIDSANRAEVDVSSVDIVIQIRARTGSYHSDFNADHPLYDEIVQLEKNADGALLILSVQPMGTLPDKLGHFGFKDGISQPQFALQHPAAPKLEGPSYPADLPLPAGELFLGHKNSRNDPDGGTSFSKLRRDGTFLVIRKMAQDVAALDSMVEHNQKSGSRDEILGQLLGRYPDGRPLPDTAKGNEFDYDSDPDGKTVPLYSHIRRTNPRKSPHKGDLPDPRILRRGMSFGSTFSQADAQTPRGLIFQAYNASIAEQFEVIQRWISGGNETSPYSRLNDPLFGVRHIRDHDRNYPAHLNGTAKDLEKIDKPFASLHWGLYLFVPSLKGLREIVNSSPTSSASDAELARGQALINEILSMEQEGRLGEARNDWKAILEDSAYQENGDNLAVWRAIRDAHSGALKTKTFGTLVADKNLIYEVLGDLDTYNVEKYHERLEQTSGINYLGLPKEEHAAQSREANGYMSEISYEVALEEAFQIATGALAPLGKLGKSATIPLPKYIDLALAYVCRNRFGIPEDGTYSIFQTGGEPLVGSTTVHCPYHVYSTSRYVFQPEPEEHVKKTAITEGNQMKAAVIKYLSSGAELTAWSQGLKDRLTANGKGDLFPQVLLGALLGFLPSANGNFLQTMGEWIRTDEFWRVRNTYLSLLNKGQVAEAREFVRKSFGRTMGMVPVPGIIHRTASVKTTLGSHSIEAGDHIVLGLISATAAEPDNSDVDPIFGGIYTGETHACPGRNLALGTQIGVTCALLSLPGALLRTPSEYALDYRPLEQPGSA